MFARPSVAALNHLLAQNDWALTRLAHFGGKTVRFHIAPFSFSYTILPDGFITVASEDTQSDARCVIAPSLLPRLALRDNLAYNEILSDGNSALLTELFYLSRNLQWDAAEDLSRFSGDILAERIIQSLQDSQQILNTSASNLFASTVEYWSEERPLIVKPQQLATFMHQVDALRDDMARLEQRIHRLSNNSTKEL